MIIRAVALASAIFMTAAAHAAGPTPAAPALTPTQAEAQANQRESDAYGRLVKASPDFRTKRMHLECDPIDDPDLKKQCMDSFKN